MLDRSAASRPPDARNVCVSCFADDDLKKVIWRHQRKGRCAFCGSRGVAVMPLHGMADYLERIIHANYKRAVDELPWEGGYQGGTTSDTWELLIEDIGVPLHGPGEEALGNALAEEIGEETWCDYDWTSLDTDESLRFSWDQFCNTIKHQRRYFFHDFGRSTYGGADDRSPIELLQEIQALVEDEGLVRNIPAGLTVFRARPREARQRYTLAAELGPPPADRALQSNRMNPPGIPMFYAADTESLALAEVRQRRASIGAFRTVRAIRLLDLCDLPAIPGFFSREPRTRRLKLAFLHDFTGEIMKPVPRDDRTDIDYLPTQAFTEFLRDADFGAGRLDGIRYPSATGHAGQNVVLFAGRGDIVGVEPDDFGVFTRSGNPWIELTGVRQR